MDKKDPICGMQGSIPKYNHYFCSQNCIQEYEKQHQIKPADFMERPWFKKLNLTVNLLLAIGIIAVLQKTGTMIPAMGIVFVLLAFLKFLDLKGFAQGFAMYDIVAKRSKLYATTYPFIELALGLAYLFKWQIIIAASVTLIIMVVGTIGVTQNLLAKNPVKCACLGTWIKVPLTKFTFFEDIFMAIMALMILLSAYGVY